MNILVVAAHPDDEVLGCGGTIAKHVYNGDSVFVVIVAQGITSRGGDTRGINSSLLALQSAARKANDLLGVKELFLLEFPDNRLDSIDRLEIIKCIEKLVDQIRPTVVYTHHFGDLNIDHQRVYESTVVACRFLPKVEIQRILFFEVPSSTDTQLAPYRQFHPTWFVDVSRFLQIKLDALRAYQCEMREFPHPRSMKGVESLAQWRGAEIGCEAAEAFLLGRGKF